MAKHWNFQKGDLFFAWRVVSAQKANNTSDGLLCGALEKVLRECDAEGLAERGFELV